MKIALEFAKYLVCLGEEWNVLMFHLMEEYNKKKKLNVLKTG